jgi:hypothetical protein
MSMSRRSPPGHRHCVTDRLMSDALSARDRRGEDERRKEKGRDMSESGEGNEREKGLVREKERENGQRHLMFEPISPKFKYGKVG